MKGWGIALVTTFVLVVLAEFVYLMSRGIQYVTSSDSGETRVFVGADVPWLVGAGALVIAVVGAGFARSVLRRNRSTRRKFS